MPVWWYGICGIGGSMSPKHLREELDVLLSEIFNLGMAGGGDFPQINIRDQYESTEKEVFALLQAHEQEVATDICTIIDIVESQSDTNSLEEWKQYKAIRNAIRDKYLSQQSNKEEALESFWLSHGGEEYRGITLQQFLGDELQRAREEERKDWRTKLSMMNLSLHMYLNDPEAAQKNMGITAEGLLLRLQKELKALTEREMV